MGILKSYAALSQPSELIDGIIALMYEDAIMQDCERLSLGDCDVMVHVRVEDAGSLEGLRMSVEEGHDD